MTIAQRATAARLIAAKGQAVTLTRRAAGTYDTATGTASIGSTTQTGKGVILPFATGLRKMAGNNIPATDRQCLLSALGDTGAALTAPKVDDTLTDAGGRVYTVVEVGELAPDGVTSLYELTVRANT